MFFCYILTAIFECLSTPQQHRIYLSNTLIQIPSPSSIQQIKLKLSYLALCQRATITWDGEIGCCYECSGFQSWIFECFNYSAIIVWIGAASCRQNYPIACYDTFILGFFEFQQLILILIDQFIILFFYTFTLIQYRQMGCNQASPNTIHQAKVTEIPCTPEEIARYINDLRANPTKYALILEKEIQKFTDQYSIALDQDVLYRTNQGKQVWKQTIQFLKQVKPLPPMQIHEGLCRAATIHAEDLVDQKDISHTGSDGSQPLQRVTKFCRKGYGKTGQNIGTDFKLNNRNFAQNTVVGLVIDDGVSDRGHRLSIFDKDFMYFGSASRIQGDKIITVINYLSKNWETLSQ